MASYSGGKDSVLAVYRAMQVGMVPLAFIITFNIDRKRSWYHAVPEPVLESVSESVGVPVWLIKTSGDKYSYNFERHLHLAKEKGAQVCVFGDIDIEGHIKWCTERCESAGLEAMFPLYGCSREAVVNDFIDSGFTAHFTIIDTDRVNGDFLGRQLTKKALLDIEAQGADICGENGEYHTFVSDGPIFSKPVEFAFGEMITEEKRVILPIAAHTS